MSTNWLRKLHAHPFLAARVLVQTANVHNGSVDMLIRTDCEKHLISELQVIAGCGHLAGDRRENVEVWQGYIYNLTGLDRPSGLQRMEGVKNCCCFGSTVLDHGGYDFFL